MAAELKEEAGESMRLMKESTAVIVPAAAGKAGRRSKAKRKRR